MEPVLLYDTTLRDGTQGENITFSADEKIKIALRLDDFGIHYIEGGWPGSNPKDMQFFDLAKRVEFRQARLVAFGSTRKPGIQPAEDDNLKALIASKTPTVAIFGKSWDLHVREVMNNSLAENLAMIHDSVTFLKDNDLEVVYDAEHFFDGYKNDADYALKSLQAAIEGGADFVVLCDTNGGTLPFEIESIMKDVQNSISGTTSHLADWESIRTMTAAWRWPIRLAPYRQALSWFKVPLTATVKDAAMRT
jgi:2-isopropylmalate synthase